MENQIKITFHDGPIVQIDGPKPGDYHLRFIDRDLGVLVYDTRIKSNHWAAAGPKFYVPWRIEVSLFDSLIRKEDLDLQDKDVFILLDSRALGDTVAWAPYLDEFRKTHKCQVYAGTYWNSILDYPEIRFIDPGEVGLDRFAAVYRIGCADNNYMRNKQNWRAIPIQQVASDYLGLPYTEIRPRLVRSSKPRPLAAPYVAISEYSTFLGKQWLFPNGWQSLVDWIRGRGYEVMSVSKEQTNLRNVMRRNDKPIEETSNNIQHAECFIGVSSGLSIMAWSLNVPVVIISGMTEAFAEFKDCTRVINESVCHGCFNDIRHTFDRAAARLCPRGKNFECTKQITLDSVVAAVDPLVQPVAAVRSDVAYETDEFGVVHQSDLIVTQTYDCDYVATRYDNLSDRGRGMSLLRVGYVAGALGAVPGSVLDVGYGNGDFLKVMRERNADCYGLDISGYPLPDGCRALTLDELKGNAFELVTFYDSLEHITDPRVILKALDATYVAITVPRYPGQEAFPTWKHRRPGEHLHHFDRTSLAKVMAAYGYDEICSSSIEDLIRGGLENTITSVFCKQIRLEKTLFISPHLSTGGGPQYLLQCVENAVPNAEVVEWNNWSGDQFNVQKDRIKNLCPVHTMNGGYRMTELRKIVETFAPTRVHLHEFPETFMDPQSANWLYRKGRPYQIVETTHGTDSLNGEAKIYLPDSFSFVCEYSKNKYAHLGIETRIVEYRIKKQSRPNRNEVLRELRLDPIKRHVLNVALFAPWKNQAEIFEAARRLPEIEFHCVGGLAGNFEEYWKPLTKSKPDNVTIWGQREDVDAFYSAMDLFLFPSLNELNPLAVKEALSWSLPVLMRNLPSYCGTYDNEPLITFIGNDLDSTCASIRGRLRGAD